MFRKNQNAAIRPPRPVPAITSSSTTTTTTPDDMPTNWKLLESLHNFEEKFNINNNNNNQMFNGPQQPPFGNNFGDVVSNTAATADLFRNDDFKSSPEDEEVYYDLPRTFGL